MLELDIHAPRRVLAIAIATVLLATACTGAGPTSGSAAPAETVGPPASVPAGSGGEVCADLEALQAAITALTQVDITSGGTEALAAAVADVKTAAEALRSSASSELATVAETFETQVDALEAAVSQLGQGDAAGLVAVGAAITGLVSAAQDLQAQFEAACP